MKQLSFNEKFKKESTVLLEKLEENLKINIPKLEKTIGKELLPDVKRFKLSQMVIGSVTEFNEVQEKYEKIAEIIEATIINKKEKIDNISILSIEKDLILEIGDLYWYLVHLINYLDVDVKLMTLVASETCEIKNFKDSFIIQNNNKMLDSVKKYLFQFHDLEKFEADFVFHIIILLQCSFGILLDINVLNENVGIDKRYTVAKVLDEVVIKLEKRYEGGSFSASKSMKNR